MSFDFNKIESNNHNLVEIYQIGFSIRLSNIISCSEYETIKTILEANLPGYSFTNFEWNPEYFYFDAAILKFDSIKKILQVIYSLPYLHIWGISLRAHDVGYEFNKIDLTLFYDINVRNHNSGVTIIGFRVKDLVWPELFISPIIFYIRECRIQNLHLPLAYSSNIDIVKNRQYNIINKIIEDYEL